MWPVHGHVCVHAVLTALDATGVPALGTSADALGSQLGSAVAALGGGLSAATSAAQGAGAWADRALSGLGAEAGQAASSLLGPSAAPPLALLEGLKGQPPHFGSAAAARGVEALAQWAGGQVRSLEVLDPQAAAGLTSALQVRARCRAS